MRAFSQLQSLRRCNLEGVRAVGAQTLMGHDSACPSSKILALLLERDRRNVFAQLTAFPPCTGLSMFFSGRKAVVVKHRARVTGRLVGKRVAFEQSDHRWRTS